MQVSSPNTTTGVLNPGDTFLIPPDFNTVYLRTNEQPATAGNVRAVNLATGEGAEPPATLGAVQVSYKAVPA